MTKIAVDENLSNVRNLLTQQGFEVIPPAKSSDASAFVISGMQENLLGIGDITEAVPVIDARGMTPQEVLNSLRDRLGNR